MLRIGWIASRESTAKMYNGIRGACFRESLTGYCYITTMPIKSRQSLSLAWGECSARLHECCLAGAFTGVFTVYPLFTYVLSKRDVWDVSLSQ